MLERLSRDADQESDADQHHQKIGAAITDERQWQTFIRKRSSHDTDINGCLQADQKSDTRREQHSKSVACSTRDINSSHDHQSKSGQNPERCDQSEFFTNDREDEIGVVLRHKTELLPAIPEAEAV